MWLTISFALQYAGSYVLNSSSIEPSSLRLFIGVVLIAHGIGWIYYSLSMGYADLRVGRLISELNSVLAPPRDDESTALEP